MSSLSIILLSLALVMVIVGIASFSWGLEQVDHKNPWTFIKLLVWAFSSSLLIVGAIFLTIVALNQKVGL